MALNNKELNEIEVSEEVKEERVESNAVGEVVEGEKEKE